MSPALNKNRRPPHETADAKAMRDRAQSTLLHLVALMEVEFLAPGQFKSLPESARPLADLKDIPSTWFSEPVERCDLPSLQAEAKSLFQDYEELLYCLHAVRRFKVNIAKLQKSVVSFGWKDSGFARGVHQEVHRLRASIAMLALQKQRVCPAIETTGYGGAAPELLQQKYIYQVKSLAADISLDCFDATDDFSMAERGYASGFKPRLVVFEDMSSPLLEAYLEIYRKYNGDIFLGEHAWKHVCQNTSANLQICIDRYCRNPLSFVPSAIAHKSEQLSRKGLAETEAPSWARVVLGRC